MMNGLENYLSQDSSAIRQFCSAARVEEEERQRHGEGEWYNELDFTTDVDELVDTFFNVEYCDKEKSVAPEEKEEEPNLPDFPMMDDDVYYESNTSTMDDDIDLAFLIREEEKAAIIAINGVDQGLQLVHLLLACAEAVGCRDAQLADSILTQIWPRVTPWGDSLQRVSQCFAVGLKSRLSLLHNVNPNGSFSTRAVPNFSTATAEEKTEALDLLHQTTPYIAFAFVAANHAICHAASAARKESLHIIDLGMEHDNLQWPSLLSTLSLSPRPPKRIRITGFVGDRDPTRIESGMGRLAGEAAALGISLEYSLVREGVSPLTLTREKLEVRDEEALFVNSVLQLHKHVKESRGSLKAVLQSIKRLGPALLTVVEQDANHNGPFFLGRFLESLHYYSAIFDSLDAILPRDSHERMKIERFHFSEEICNVVACEGGERVERHERADQWRRQLGRAGFQGVGLRCLDEAKMAVCGYGCDGYTVGSDKGCLQLGWKGRPIMVASAWQLNNTHHSSI